MKTRSFFAALSLFLVMAVGALPQAHAKDEWIKVRSKNFYLTGNATDKEIRRIATRLEQFRTVFSSLFPTMKFVSPIPTTVIVFKSDKAFKPYKPINASGKTTEWVAGYFQPGEDINYITLTTEREQDETFRTIFHEYVHFLVDNTLGKSRVPPWFNEGLAEYYEQFSIENDQKVTLGSLNQNALRLLGTYPLIPLETFFDIDYTSLHLQGGHGASIFYAQSWAMMHYLIKGNQGKRNPQLAAFMELLARGIKTREAFRQAFQTDYAVMDMELKRYVAQNTFNISVANFTQKLVFEADMTTSPMTDAEAKATLGDLLSHSDRLADAETHLMEALAMDGESVMANTALGFVKMRQQKYEEAKKYLEKAASADKQNFLVYYRYAYILSREFVDANHQVSAYSDETAAKMREALGKAIAINPGFPDSYAQLAMISLVRNERIEEGIANLNKAIALAPGNQVYQLNLVSLYINLEDYEKAQPLAENVARTAVEPHVKARAESMLSNLAFMKEQLELEKSQGRTGPRRVLITPEGKPPTEEEIAKVRAEAEFESINSALRKPKEGEERVAAHLSKIECSGGNIVYIARAGDRPIRFQSKDFQGLYLMALEPSFTSEIGCGTIKKEFFAILTYLPKENPKMKTRGELVSIEIVPEKFDFLTQKTQ
jgi:tetratricopeptide (TPR) repeat protein